MSKQPRHLTAILESMVVCKIRNADENIGSLIYVENSYAAYYFYYCFARKIWIMCGTIVGSHLPFIGTTKKRTLHMQFFYWLTCNNLFANNFLDYRLNTFKDLSPSIVCKNIIKLYNIFYRHKIFYNIFINYYMVLTFFK